MVTYQKQTADSPGKVAPWIYAGLMTSYWCPVRCAFCYVSCDPNHTFWVDEERLFDWWKQLETLACQHGQHIKIHLTGGEAFGNWKLLVRILELVRSAGLPAPEKIETNAYWATDSDLIDERLKILKELGVTLLTSDADVFHQEFIPIDNVKRLVDSAQKILGPDGIRIRWWDFYNFVLENKIDISELDPQELQEIQIDALLNGRERLNGRAAIQAGKLIQGEPPEALADQTCQRGILKSKHIHIDPYGNIFPGTCGGIILGNAVGENIADVYHWLNTRGPSGPIIPVLVEKGPAGLLPLAQRYGFKPWPNGYISKCQLCYHLRWTIYRAGQCHKWLGPDECYPKCL